MATQALSTEHPDASKIAQGCSPRYMARQAILDRLGRVHGYELLYRSGPDAFFLGDGNLATSTMLDNAVLFGFDRLTSGQPAFVKCTPESLNERLVDVLLPGMTILHLQESLPPTPELIASCQVLKTSGFRLALGSYCWEPGYEPLVELADYIKVDFTLLCTTARHYLQRRAHNVAAALVAERVETKEDYDRACSEGFSLFQGYFLHRPELLKKGKPPANLRALERIDALLQHDSLDLQDICTCVKQDISFAYRLLQQVNSPGRAMRQEVLSIDAALRSIDEDSLRRIARLAIASEASVDQPVESLRAALERGRFCELAAAMCALDPAEQYLLGLLSLLPDSMGMSMHELAPSLPLREPIRSALQGTASKERVLLSWFEAHGRGDEDECAALAVEHGLNQKRLMLHSAAAVAWAKEALDSSI
jgi:EAL and modified HD-GYP domain-containing signal transduction protein